MSDIVERLNETVAMEPTHGVAPVLSAARDEIVRLRAEVDRAGVIVRERLDMLVELQAERDRLRDEADTLRAAINYALRPELGDGLVFLREWNEGDAAAMAELSEHRAALGDKP